MSRRLCCRAAIALGLAAAVFLAISADRAAAEAPPKAKLQAVLDDMVLRRGEFLPERLWALGPEGFDAVLDHLFPETAPPPVIVEIPRQTLDQLVADLGSESFRTREEAARQLREFGEPAHATLKEAAKNPDAEISWRAVSILKSYDKAKLDDRSRFVPAMTACLRQLDEPGRLRQLSRRSAMVLEKAPTASGKQQIINEAIATLYRAHDDKYFEPFKPLLAKGEVRNQQQLFNALRSAYLAEANAKKAKSAKQGGGEEAVEPKPKVAEEAAAIPFVPRLYFEAISPDRPELTQVVLDRLVLFPADMLPELKTRLQAVFAGGDENLKLKACRPLVEQCNDEGAIDFLAGQISQSNDNTARAKAIRLLLGGVPRSTPMPDRLREAVIVVAKDASAANERHVAVTVLGAYADAKSIRALIGFINDKSADVSNLARATLIRHADKAAVRKVVEEVLESSPKEADKKVLEALQTQMRSMQ